jgi:glutaredoxin
MLTCKPAVNNAFLALLLGAALAWASPTTASAGTPDLSVEPKRGYGSIDVILYQTSWCPYCTKARTFLQEMGVSLSVIDIEREPEKRQEMMAKSGSPGVPVIDVEGTVIRGYAPDAMRNAIERKRRE